MTDFISDVEVKHISLPINIPVQYEALVLIRYIFYRQKSKSGKPQERPDKTSHFDFGPGKPANYDRQHLDKTLLYLLHLNISQ